MLLVYLEGLIRERRNFSIAADRTAAARIPLLDVHKLKNNYLVLLTVTAVVGISMP